MKMHERLKEAREKAGFESARSAAEAFGIAASTYAAHENGTRVPSLDDIEKYARRLRTTPEWLAFNKSGGIQEPIRIENGEPAPEDMALVPAYEVYASAGPGALVEEEQISHSLAFPPDYLRSITTVSPKYLTIISVKGDSMEPTLPHGSIVMLDMSKQNLGYDGLFVIRIDDTLHVKRIGRSAQHGHVLIISDNPRHRDLDMPVERIEPVGKVLWYGREA